MDRGAQWATVHGVEKSWMGLRDSAQHSTAQHYAQKMDILLRKWVSPLSVFPNLSGTRITRALPSHGATNPD